MDLKYHMYCASAMRLLFIAWSYIQDGCFEIKYTDIDYQVFTDAAEFITMGSSPFKRHTYRYTPILSVMLIPNILIHDSFGKILFCILDILTCLLIYETQKIMGFPLSFCKTCACLWFYNPLTIVISSRGNAESIMAFFVILTIYLQHLQTPYLLGLVYGLSIHFKIYPCIYLLSLYFSFSPAVAVSTKWEKACHLMKLNLKKLIFLLTTLVGFLIPTLISMVNYEEYLDEALLYHFKRKDIRHNFSPLFYLLYLSESSDFKFSYLFANAGFLLQALLIAVVSFSLRNFLPAAMLVETVVFVTFNKVCTSQYFLWYLSLIPLNYHLLKGNVKYFSIALLPWIIGQSVWLLFAYLLEFKGFNTFIFICLSSLFFFAANIYLIGLFLKQMFLVDKIPRPIDKFMKRK